MSWGQIILLIVLAIVALLIAANWAKVRRLIDAAKVFYQEVKFEMTKVVWPTKQEVVNSTVIVLVVTTLLTLTIMVVDAVLGHLVTFIFRA